MVPPRARRDRQLPHSPLGLQRPQGKAALSHSPTGLYFLPGTFPKVSMPAGEDARVWKLPTASRAASRLGLQLSRRNTGTEEFQPAGCAPDGSQRLVCAGEEVTPTLMCSCWPHAHRSGTREGTPQPPWKCPDPVIALEQAWCPPPGPAARVPSRNRPLRWISSQIHVFRLLKHSWSFSLSAGNSRDHARPSSRTRLSALKPRF